MKDIVEQYSRPMADPIPHLVNNLRRGTERGMLEELSRIRIDRLPDGEIKEQLLDLRSRARKHFRETL